MTVTDTDLTVSNYFAMAEDHYFRHTGNSNYEPHELDEAYAYYVCLCEGLRNDGNFKTVQLGAWTNKGRVVLAERLQATN